MSNPNSFITFISFTVIFAVWLIWNSIQPFLSGAQIALLFPFIPISALLIALSFLDNEDDDDRDNGMLEPIYQRARN